MTAGRTKRAPYPEGLGPDPDRYFIKLYVAFLQGWFNFLEEDHPYHWEPDDKRAGLWIGAEAPIRHEIVQARPAITVMMGPTATAAIGIDNMVSTNLSTHETLRTDLEQGHLVVYVIARNDIEATRIARLVMTATRAHRNLLEGEGGFFQIARGPIGRNSPSPPGALVPDAPESSLRMVQVNLPCSFQVSWKTWPNRQSPQHRSIGQILNQRRAQDYPYVAPQVLERVHLSASVRPVQVRVIHGRYGLRPVTVQVGEKVEDFQQSDLTPQE